jgi:hypothetical protein
MSADHMELRAAAFVPWFCMRLRGGCLARGETEGFLAEHQKAGGLFFLFSSELERPVSLTQALNIITIPDLPHF